MFLYFDENDYVIGYGSDYEDGSIEINVIPFEVDMYLGAYKFNKVTGEFIPDNHKIEYLENQRKLEREIGELSAWFTWYDQQCVQYQRSLRLGIEFNRDIAELDNQAKINANEITRLRTEMSKPYSVNS